MSKLVNVPINMWILFQSEFATMGAYLTAGFEAGM